MASYEVLRTNHTGFTVSSLDRSIPFFRDCLGFEVTSRARRDPKMVEIILGVPGADIEVAYLSGSGHTVELIQYLSPAGIKSIKQRPCDLGFGHIALDVSGIDALLAKAGQFGFKPLGPPVVSRQGGPNAGRTICYLRDDDGVTVELIQAAAAGT